MYEDSEGAKTLAENPQGSHRRKHMNERFHFLAGACDVGAGNNSQCILGGTTRRHPYEATLGREAFRRHRDFLMNLS